MFSLIDTYKDVVKSVDKTNNTVTLQNNKKILFTLVIKKKNSQLVITPLKQDTHSIHLTGLIIHNKFTDPNQIPELMAFIIDNLNNITNYCVGCYTKMGHQSDQYINCGNDECVYKYEELRFGNPVIEKFKADPDIFVFLLRSSFDAITCNRKYDIFEPFPSRFLKGDQQLERGKMSKLTGKDLDNYKDFAKLEQIVQTLKLDKLVEELDMFIKDEHIVDVFGEDLYILIRFIVMSCKVEIVLDTSMKDIPKGCNIYRIVHQMDQDKEYETRKKASGKSHYLFHGSTWHNWHSIMRNGLKNCSGGKLMTAGAAHGSGIYLSSDSGYSINYGKSVGKSVIGVFEVLGEKDKYKKASTIFVCPDEEALLQRYLIVISTNVTNTISRLNTLFNKEIYVENANTQTVITTRGIKKLVKEYKIIAKTIKKNPDSLGFKVQVDAGNAFLWNVLLDKYDEEFPVGKDMKKFGIKGVEMEMRFPDSYPFNPPFVRVVKPRFKHLTGNVTSGGSVCMEVLTPKGWSPACSIETLLVSIKSQILEGDGRIDPDNYNLEYSLKDAEASFIRVAKGHNWL